MRLYLRRILLWLSIGVVVSIVLLNGLFYHNSSDQQLRGEQGFDDPVRRRHHHAGPRDFHPRHGLKAPSAGWPLYSIYAPDYNASLWPSPSGERSDRIINQINN